MLDLLFLALCCCEDNNSQCSICEIKEDSQSFGAMYPYLETYLFQKGFVYQTIGEYFTSILDRTLGSENKIEEKTREVLLQEDKPESS
ncbi:hypothetical protein [[Clostridium] polysaccharolyticum]|uniref:Uncharacterized protein n=1 Tax=[Clostridium] polysaccharolyticum TaxID=29364 RepID=A0A1I0EJL6_9FIRM|nr:hypothetical protein [[Clostridium] polysaccharolyticum]SET45402.1 hypothetical protein SAMN04487772_12216 [[Clostridium] polysaccharolyticum]